MRERERDLRVVPTLPLVGVAVPAVHSDAVPVWCPCLYKDEEEEEASARVSSPRQVYGLTSREEMCYNTR